MRILIFAQSLSMGGAERVAALWATGFANNGHDVQFALMADESVPRTYPIPNSVSVVSARSTIKGRVGGFISRFRKTGQIIKNFRPDVILVVLHVQDIPIWFYTRGTKIKIIQTEHNSYERPAEAPMSRYDRFNKFFRNRLFDAVTVLTEADKSVIRGRMKNVYVLPNPLAFEPVNCTPAKKKIILGVGRLDVYYTKGFDLLIKAFALVHKKHIEWKLRIVGSGNQENALILRKLAKEAGIEESVEFVPFTDNILQHYQEAEIFCLSSRFEGFGMVLIEAMSQGCACVACDYKGRQKEILTDNSQGLICACDDVVALSENLCYMITNETERKLIQKTAIARSYDFRLENIMLRWNAILDNI